MKYNINSYCAANKVDLLAYAVLCSAVVLTYFNCLGHDFVFWDDPIYIVYNEATKGFSIDHLRLAFTKSYSNNYAPIQIISYMLDYQIWGFNPSGFILTNLLLHFFNGVLVYHLYKRLFLSNFGALLAATIFLVHPVQVESVAWASQRKNVLSMFFFLVSFGFYIRSVSEDERRYYWVSVIVYSLALLTKVAAIVLPLIIILYDFCYSQSDHFRTRLKKYTPYLITSLILAFIAINTQKYYDDGGQVAYYGGTVYKTVLTVLVTFPQYLFNFFCPMFLSTIYSPPIKQAIDIEVVICMLLIILFVIEGVILFHRRRQLFFWYVFFFVPFLPVLQIVPLPTIMQDRYLYFPLIGLCGCIAWAVGKMVNKAELSFTKYLIMALCFVPVPFLMYTANKHTSIWEDPLSLVRETAKLGIGSRYGIYNDFVNTQVADTCTMMAKGYKGKVSDSVILHYYLEALSYVPLHYDALQNAGFLLLERGNYPAAYKYFYRLTENYDRSFAGFYGLGQTYQRIGNNAKASEAYRRALALNPTYAPAIKAMAEL
jgi:hypothetical protein